MSPINEYDGSMDAALAAARVSYPPNVGSTTSSQLKRGHAHDVVDGQLATRRK